MKQKTFFAGALMLMFAGATLPSHAADNYAGLLGDPAALAAASRTVIIGLDTEYVNMTHGDVVKFVVGDKTFAWNFNGPARVSVIDLDKIAPPGTLDHPVKVYIRRDPATNGG